MESTDIIGALLVLGVGGGALYYLWRRSAAQQLGEQFGRGAPLVPIATVASPTIADLVRKQPLRQPIVGSNR